MEGHRISSLSVAWVVLLSTLCLVMIATRVASERDADDEYRRCQQKPQQQQTAADEELYNTEVKAEPADNEWYDLQALKHSSAAAPAPLQKRHLCKAKYVYNPVSGRCQPSLSALRGQGR